MRPGDLDYLARRVLQARINSGPAQAECVARGFAMDFPQHTALELLDRSYRVEPLQWAG